MYSGNLTVPPPCMTAEDIAACFGVGPPAPQSSARFLRESGPVEFRLKIGKYLTLICARCLRSIFMYLSASSG